MQLFWHFGQAIMQFFLEISWVSQFSFLSFLAGEKCLVKKFPAHIFRSKLFLAATAPAAAATAAAAVSAAASTVATELAP